MPVVFRRVAVLGAGTMGAQIAAHLANQGIPVDLFDLSRELVDKAKQRLAELKPSPIYTREVLDLIRPGSFQDEGDLQRLGEAEWVVEAVLEQLPIKQQLWQRVAPYLRPGGIYSTNTSGLSIRAIASALPEEARRRFLGTHFFNPPRYLHLLELIPTPETDPAVVEAMRDFATRILGKGVVLAKDTPNFIANRIGCYGLMVTVRAMQEFGLGPDEVDEITGENMGRPKSATFRTLDVVGIDVMKDVADNTRAAVQDPEEQAAFTLPEFMRQLVERGWTGEKAGQGFYKRVKQPDGSREILVLDPATMEYRPRRRLQAPSLQAVRAIEDPLQRIKTLLAADDVAGRFAWEITRRSLAYAANKLGEIADDVASIDRAIKWGFGWNAGPFELWDALGAAAVLARMEQDGERLPDWLVEAIKNGPGRFYVEEDGRTLALAAGGEYVPVDEDPRAIDVPALLKRNRVVDRNTGATLVDLGDEVLLLDFHGPKQAIGPDFIQMVEKAVAEVEANWRGLVISSHVKPNFSVGANLMLMLLAAQMGEWDEIDAMVRRFQYANMKLKYAARPVVVAPYGITVGGGCEVALHADQVVASAETYIGLVEVGAGVIPGGGGTKEMLLRAIENVPEVFSGKYAQTPGPATTDVMGRVNLQVLVNRVFELIATARVALSAAEARQLGFFRNTDRIVTNPDHLIYEAKRAVLALDEAGYRPPVRRRIPVVGDSGRALLELAATSMHWSGYASEHDLKIARKLAHVLAGGDVPPGTEVDEDYLLNLEREAFLSLVGEPKTQARMQHLLKTGKPLRN
ncbi:3-hydroxyacyl-CoA dehydrogenase/enoyl-CoA hydratase family protein [Thermaerobacter litoralis]